jgi:hypothetical protein
MPSRATWPVTPEDLAAREAHGGPLPQWMAEELDRRDREDAGTEDDVDVVKASAAVMPPRDSHGAARLAWGWPRPNR